MKLTPLDIHHKEFRRSIRGYNEEEVDVFLDQVAEEFERFFKENAELKEKVEAMQGKVKQYEGVEQTLQKALFTGQQAADQVKENADKEAEIIVADAENKARELIQAVQKEKQTVVAELRLLREAESDFRERFQQVLSGFMNEVAQIKVELPEEVEEEMAAPVEAAPTVEESAAEESAAEESAEMAPAPEVTPEDAPAPEVTPEDAPAPEVTPAPEERDEQEPAARNSESEPAAFDAQPTLVMQPADPFAAPVEPIPLAPSVPSVPAELLERPFAEIATVSPPEFKITLGALSPTPVSAPSTPARETVPDEVEKEQTPPTPPKETKASGDVVSSFFDDDLGGD